MMQFTLKTNILSLCNPYETKERHRISVALHYLLMTRGRTRPHAIHTENSPGVIYIRGHAPRATARKHTQTGLKTLGFSEFSARLEDGTRCTAEEALQMILGSEEEFTFTSGEDRVMENESILRKEQIQQRTLKQAAMTLGKLLSLI